MMKKASGSNNLSGSAGLSIFLGLRDGSRRGLLVAHGRGFNSLQVHALNSPRSGANHPWGTSSGRNQEDGVSRPAVILAHRPEESKGQNACDNCRTECEKFRKDHIWTMADLLN